MAFSATPIVTLTGFSVDTNTAVTGSGSTTGADLLIASVADEGATAPVVTDSKVGNTWHQLSERDSATGRTTLYWCTPVSVGAGHTVTATTTGGFPSIVVYAFSGSAASPFDQENGASSNSASSLATGSVTPTENSELVITACGSPTAMGTTIDSVNGGLTISGSVAVGANNDALAMAYLVQTLLAPSNPTWTLSASDTVQVAIATFKASGATPLSGGSFFLVL